jgi:Ring finger domain/RING-H2 zinc finger domain
MMDSTNSMPSKEELVMKLKECEKLFESATTAFAKDSLSKIMDHYKSLIKEIDEDTKKKRKELEMELNKYEKMFESTIIEFVKENLSKLIDHYKSLIEDIDKEGNENTFICAICLDSHKKDDVYSFLCDHSFHGNCIEQWLRNNKTCPSCRANIPIDHIEIIKHAIQTKNRISNMPLRSTNIIHKCDKCLNDIKQTIGYVLECGHSFHVDCIEEWLRNNRTCPTCKVEIHAPYIERIKQLVQEKNRNVFANMFHDYISS